MLSVAIIVPAHNEERGLRELVLRTREVFLDAKRDFEIIIVDDSSKDRTGEIADELAFRYAEVRAVHRKNPPSFGKALKVGFMKAGNEVVIPLMGDGTDDPNDALKMLETMQRDGVDFVVGSRYIEGGTIRGMPIFKYLFSRGVTRFVNLLLGVKMTDVTNAFKAYKATILKNIELVSNGFDITVELPMRAVYRGYTYKEVPVKWTGKGKGLGLNLIVRGHQYVIRSIKLALESLTRE